MKNEIIHIVSCDNYDVLFTKIHFIILRLLNDETEFKVFKKTIQPFLDNASSI
jgi:hypothetical protein